MKDKSDVYIAILILITAISIITAYVLISNHFVQKDNKDAEKACKFNYDAPLSMFYLYGDCYYYDDYGIKVYLRYNSLKKEWIR